MSTIKKVVITFIALVVLLLAFASPVSASYDGKAKFGLTQINSDSTTLKLSVDQKWDLDIVGLVLETDYVYKESDDVVKMDKFSTIGKVNKDLSQKYYAFSVVSYDADKLRASGDRAVAGAGVGWKILRTDNWKVSHESSVAYLTNDIVSEAILRNSLWVFYKLNDNISITNKLLSETGTDTYLRNETGINYSLTETVSIGLSNIYTEDPVDNHVLNVTIGITW
jgi:putative salt-induced outer membrane protein YdiY